MLKTIKRLNRKVLDILAFSDTREDKINESTTLLSDTLNCDVFLLDNEFIFVSTSTDKYDCDYFKQFRNIDIQRENMSLDNNFILVTPLVSSRENLGFFVCIKNIEFTETDIVIFELFRNYAITTLYNINRDKNFSKQRQKNIVKNSISSFSYSELHAIASIFSELDGSEGIVIASSVSEKYNVTRSVIVSALRKFESSGVIESRSLGAKGTFIKVINPFLLEEIEVLKNDFINK